jgi:hypothetical protein
MLLPCALWLAIAPAQAQNRNTSREGVLDDLVRRLQICGETQDATRRLQCYDQIGRSMGYTPPPGTPRADVGPQPIGPGAGSPPPYNPPPIVGGSNIAPPPGGSDEDSVNPTPYADRAYNPNDPNDRRGVGADPYPPPPQPQVRRTGPGPLPGGAGRLPVVSLQTSDFGYNEQRYWQVAVDLANNIGQVIDAEVQCTFTNANRPVKDAYFLASAMAPGEHVMTEVIGPPTNIFVDGVTCRVTRPLR